MNRLVVTLLLGAIALFAQTNRGGISGTVTDQTQAVLPGATVTITNLGTNEVRKVKTSQEGTFSAPDLEPVTYRVEVESQGFKKAVVENVKVDTASDSSVNVTLTAGSIDTQVTVTADAALVNTETGTASNTITERRYPM
jgi:hypothetical protein